MEDFQDSAGSRSVEDRQRNQSDNRVAMVVVLIGQHWTATAGH